MFFTLPDSILPPFQFNKALDFYIGGNQSHGSFTGILDEIYVFGKYDSENHFFFLKIKN